MFLGMVVQVPSAIKTSWVRSSNCPGGRGPGRRSAKLQLARRLGVDEKEVRRLPGPHHGSRLPRIAEAVQALGKRLVVGLA